MYPPKEASCSEPGGVIVVLLEAVEIRREPHRAEALGLVPDAAPLGVVRLRRLAQLLLLGVVARAEDLLQERLRADLNLPTNATEADVQTLRHLLPNHALGTLLDLRWAVLLRLVCVCDGCARHTVREVLLPWLRGIIFLDRLEQLVNGVQAGGLVTATGGRQAELETLIEVHGTLREDADRDRVNWVGSLEQLLLLHRLGHLHALFKLVDDLSRAVLCAGRLTNCARLVLLLQERCLALLCCCSSFCFCFLLWARALVSLETIYILAAQRGNSLFGHHLRLVLWLGVDLKEVILQNLAVILERAILEASDLTSVALTQRHIPQHRGMRT